MIYYIYLPIVFWPIYMDNGQHINAYVRYEPTMVYGMTNENPYKYYTDDTDDVDYQPYDHQFLWEDETEDSCYEPTK